MCPQWGGKSVYRLLSPNIPLWYWVFSQHLGESRNKMASKSTRVPTMAANIRGVNQRLLQQKHKYFKQSEKNKS